MEPAMNPPAPAMTIQVVAIQFTVDCTSEFFFMYESPAAA